MYRHIFMANTKAEVTEEQYQELLAYQKSFKANIPLIKRAWVGTNVCAWAPNVRLVATSDFASKEDCEQFMNHPYHLAFVDKYGKYMDENSYVAVQYEIEE